MLAQKSFRHLWQLVVSSFRTLPLLVRSLLSGNGDVWLLLKWIRILNGLSSTSVSSGSPLTTPPASGTVRLYGWKLSYFSGKVRGYLRFKAKTCGVALEEVTASPDVLKDVLFPLTRSSAVPQVQFPDGRFVEDSHLIFDNVEEAFPTSRVLPCHRERPCQRVACQLIELLGDEWLLAPAFHWRWAYSGDGSKWQRMPAYMGGANPLPNHREYNEAQWGAFLRPKGSYAEQRRVAKLLFDTIFLTDAGIKYEMRLLGVTEETVAAWESSCRNVLRILDDHLEHHRFVLGDRPSTADFGLLGPIYAHLCKDPVPGEMVRKEFPRVASWSERLHDHGGFDEVSEEMLHGSWLSDDEVPATIIPLLHVFFAEMWPMLLSSCRAVKRYIKAHGRSVVLPAKSFNSGIAAQDGEGALTHAFTLPFDSEGNPGSSSRGRRMVLPFHIWLLQRIEGSVNAADAPVLAGFLKRFPGGEELLELPSLLEGCRLRKVGDKLFVQ
eukprot:TRINITY_DN52649_c0_g1_i1.p1 TRINITY_DN52649_c0_g1~~TRINITY_DN52649_c0_g1_i1.p1  ORF type:complete len:494 (+),score=42.37 TRINITY_DN52649_c0_g1_i1:47-1528(+)